MNALNDALAQLGEDVHLDVAPALPEAVFNQSNEKMKQAHG